MSKEPSTLRRAEGSQSTKLEGITFQKAVISTDFHNVRDPLSVTYFTQTTKD